MAYQRKTRDVWVIEGNYGYGWEEVTAEDSYKDARENMRLYRENEPEYPHRLRCTRERIGA